MSSKMTVKPSKKDRPKSGALAILEEKKSAGPDKLRKGRRDGTPEKPTTPNTQDADKEEGSPQPEKKHVIVNEEILSLQVKPEDLAQLREPRPPSSEKKTPVTCGVVVRKLKPASEWDKPKPKMVTVARPAPPDAPLKAIEHSGAAGPRFDDRGNIIPHSILGSVENFRQMAVQRGDLPVELAEPCPADLPKPTLSTKYQKVPKHPKMESVEESNALKNWQMRMMERKKQQGHLSKLLDKSADQLVMNQSDDYRQTQELRYIIDRTIPTIDYGKGYRVGSEFWNQQERIGNDLTGIHMTLAQTEKGYPPPIQHVGVPNAVRGEKGTAWTSPRTPFNKPWHKSPYLQTRKEQLQPIINELDPHIPDLMNLEIVGKSHSYDDEEENEEDEYDLGDEADFAPCPEDTDPLRDHPDVYPAPVMGPSILFAGQPARWTGDGFSFCGQVGIEARVTFEVYAGRRVTSFLEIVNDGTTSIYYDWKKVPKCNPFEVVNAKIQRFYFNNSSGVILPGDAVKFPFVFKSPNAGVFTEQWELQTHPVVCGGAALIVTLRGVALQEDKYNKHRSKLEQELSHKQAEQVVQSILDEVLGSIRSPDRPVSPVDAYVTDQEIFAKKNHGLHYHNEQVVALQALYKQLFPEAERSDKEWDFDVNNLKQLIMSMDEEDDNKQDMLGQINQAIFTMSFPPFSPAQQKMYSCGYELLTETADRIVDHVAQIRMILGIPDTDPDGSGEDAPSSDTKKPPPGGKAGKADPKDKKGAKEEKKPPKTPAVKEAPKQGGKITPAPPASSNKTRPPTRDRPGTATSTGACSPLPTGLDPVLHNKYREKLYTQAYVFMSETLDKMVDVFEQIRENDGGPQLPI